ncbi:MAG: hypothetical protein ACRC06_08545 [Waterburya sp.]
MISTAHKHIDGYEENRKLAQERVLCENAFAGVKRYNAVSENNKTNLIILIILKN